MNKRLKELAEQAWDAAAVSADFGHPVSFAEKLVKLIVKECVQVAGDNAVATTNPDLGMAKLEVVQAIIKHFGDE
jgi:hypothetical protein